MKNLFLTTLLSLTFIGGASQVRADDEVDVNKHGGNAHANGNAHGGGDAHAKVKGGHGKGADGGMAFGNHKAGGNFVPPGLAKKPGGLPPGIAKNIAKGKPMPPGIAKKFGGGAKGFAGKKHGDGQQPDRVEVE